MGRTDPGPAIDRRSHAARTALRVLAELPARQREYLTLRVAGFSYQEICALTGGSTYSHVNKQLAKARARIRLLQLQASAGATRRESAS
jgi:DNA-directed RNA polymerase specialized sigma24 family protein